MNRNKLSLLIAGVAALVVLAGGWFLGVQPQLAAASANAIQRASIETANATNRSELVRLQQQFTTLDTMKADLADLSASVPSTTDTETFIKELNATATSTGAAITSISVGDAVPYTSPVAPAAAPTDGSTASASASASASPSASPSASASATPSATPTGPATVTNPLITATNFTVIPITIAVSGSSDQALAFTKGAQTGKRLFLINSLSSSAASSAGASTDAVTAGTGTQTWTLSGYIYVLDAAAPAATATTTATTNG